MTTKWVRCPRCGRTWPETNFPISNKTGERHEICACCLRNWEWRKDQRNRIRRPE